MDYLNSPRILFFMWMVKLVLGILIVAWLYVGFFLVTRFKKLFGPHPDDPAETPGARSFGLAHIVTIWVGILGMLIWFIRIF